MSDSEDIALPRGPGAGLPLIVGGSAFALVGAAVYVGMGALGAVESSAAPRAFVAMASGTIAALFLGFLVHGRAQRALVAAHVDRLASHDEIELRNRRRYRTVAALMGAALVGGITFGVAGGVNAILYDHLNVDRYVYDRYELGPLEVFAWAIASFLTAFATWTMAKPDPFSFAESDGPSDGHDGSELAARPGANVTEAPTRKVTDQELAAVAQRVRRIQRRNRLAMSGAVLLTAGLGAPLVYYLGVYGGAAALVVGAGFFGVARSKDDLYADEDAPAALVPTGNAKSDVEAASFAERLQAADTLAVHRPYTLLTWLGLDSPPATVEADHYAMGEARDVAPFWHRFLHLSVRPCHLDVVEDGQTQLRIRSGAAAWTTTVLDVGVIKRAGSERRWQLAPLGGDTGLELRGRFFSRRHLDLFRRGERVGGLEVLRPDSPLLALLSGGSQSLSAELPTDADPRERELIATAAILFERGHL